MCVFYLLPNNNDVTANKYIITLSFEALVLQHPPNIYDVLEENGDGSFDVIFGRQTASPKNGCQK